MGFIQLQLEQRSPSAGKVLGSLDLPENTAIPLLIRAGKPIVVHSDTTLEAGDKLIAVATTEQESELRRYMLGPAV